MRSCLLRLLVNVMPLFLHTTRMLGWPNTLTLTLNLKSLAPRLFHACLDTPEKVRPSIMMRLQLVSYFMPLVASSFIVWAFLKAIERFWWMMTSYLALMQITSLANAPATWPLVVEAYV